VFSSPSSPPLPSPSPPPPPLLLLLHFALMAPVSWLQKHVLARLLRIAFVNYKLHSPPPPLFISHHFSLCTFFPAFVIFFRASKPHRFLPVPISFYDVTGSSPAHPPNPPFHRPLLDCFHPGPLLRCIWKPRVPLTIGNFMKHKHTRTRAHAHTRLLNTCKATINICALTHVSACVCARSVRSLCCGAVTERTSQGGGCQILGSRLSPLCGEVLQMRRQLLIRL